jgi:hypothetical protein
MKTWIGGAVIAAGLALFAPAAMGSADATNSKAGIHATEASKATDLSARRRNRHVRHYAYRANYRPYYYDRPYDYRPYPYETPVPFFLGFGFGPSW